MRNSIGRLVAAVIAAVLTLLAAPVAEAFAFAPAESPSFYVYAGHHHPALVTGVVTERGPPATHDTTTTDGGLRSLGDLARPNGPTTPATYAYNDLGQLAQIARGCNLAEERADGATAALAVVKRSGVAANTAPKALAASSRVAPWAGSSLSRLSREGEVMYRVYGGGAGKAGSWITPINPISSAAARQGLALPAENAALYVSKVTLPGGVRMQVGTAGSAFGQPGGWAQAQLLERIPLSSFGKGVPLQ